MECLDAGLHQPSSVVLILGFISVGAATHYSRHLGWLSLLLVIPGVLLAAAYSLWLLRYGLKSFRAKEWAITPDGRVRSLLGEPIEAKYADLHVYWGSTLVVWETGLIQVTDKSGKKWTNYYPNLNAATVAMRRLATEFRIPPTPRSPQATPVQPA